MLWCRRRCYHRRGGCWLPGASRTGTGLWGCNLLLLLRRRCLAWQPLWWRRLSGRLRWLRRAGAAIGPNGQRVVEKATKPSLTQLQLHLGQEVVPLRRVCCQSPAIVVLPQQSRQLLNESAAVRKLPSLFQQPHLFRPTLQQDRQGDLACQADGVFFPGLGIADNGQCPTISGLEGVFQPQRATATTAARGQRAHLIVRQGLVDGPAVRVRPVRVVACKQIAPWECRQLMHFQKSHHHAQSAMCRLPEAGVLNARLLPGASRDRREQRRRPSHGAANKGSKGSGGTHRAGGDA